MAQPRLLLDPEKLTAPPVGAGQTDTAVDLPAGQAGGIDELALGERLDPAADLRRRAGMAPLVPTTDLPTGQAGELDVGEAHLQAYRDWGEEVYTKESLPVYLEQMRQLRQQYPDEPSRAWAAMNRQMLATGGAVLKPEQMSPELQTYMAWKRGEAEASVAAMPSKLQQMETYGFELPTAKEAKPWGVAFRTVAMTVLEQMKLTLQLLSAPGRRTLEPPEIPGIGTLDEELSKLRIHDSAAYLQFLEANGVDTAVIREAVDQHGDVGAAQLFKGAEDVPGIFTARGLKRGGPMMLMDLGLAIVQIGGLNKAMRVVAKKKLAQRALVSAGVGAMGYTRAKAQQPGISDADAWKAGGKGAVLYFTVATLFDGIMSAVERGGVKQVAKEFRLDLNNPTDKGIAQAIYRLHSAGKFVDAEVIEEMARGRGAAGWDVFQLPPGSSRAMLLGRYRRIFRQRGYDRITRIVNGGESVAKHYGSGPDAFVRYKLDLVGWKRLEIAKRILLDPASKEAMADMFRFAKANELYAAGVTRAEELLKREAAAAAGVRPGAPVRPAAPGAPPVAAPGPPVPAIPPAMAAAVYQAKAVPAVPAPARPPRPAGPALPAAPPTGPAKTAGAELDRALASGETDPGTHRLATYLIEKIDPDFDANSAIIVSGAVKKATPEMVRAEGLPTHDEAGRPIRYAIAGETVSDLEASATRTAVRLYRGHDSDTVVEEWYHRAWTRLDAGQHAAYQAYHAASGDARTVNEHFAQEGRDFFFSERQHEQAGPIRQLFAQARDSLRALIQRVRQLRGAQIPEKIRRMYRQVGQRRWKATAAPRRPVAAGEPQPPLPTTTTVSPEQALRRYEVERGYIRAGVKYRRTKANLAKIAAAKADTHYQELKKAAQAARREDTVAVREELTADFERRAIQAVKAGTMTTELAAYVPMREWDDDVREVILDVADAILEGTKSEATRRALEKIIAGEGQDTGAAVQQQKERILNILKRGQEDYSRPGGMIPSAYDWAPAVMDKLTAGEPAGPGAAQLRREPGVGRQPWQMGEDDWEATLPAVTNEQRAQVAREMSLPVAAVDDPLVRAELDLYPGGRDHYAHVTEAMARGENVPAEAKETYSEKDLADYAKLIREDRTAEIEAAHRGYLDDASMAGLRALASAHGVSLKGVRSRAAIMDVLVERGVAQSPEMPVLVQPHIAEKFAGERWADAVLAGAPAEAPPAAKQPWEMTKAEFVADSERYFTDAGVAPEVAEDIPGNARAVHAAQVQRAVAEGKPVPANVLAEYPDLARAPAEAPRAPTEPWQMTTTEFDTVYRASVGKKTLAGRKRRPAWDSATGIAIHRQSVEDAIAEGEPVPAEVLAEYPDLAPAAKVTTDLFGRPTFAKATGAQRELPLEKARAEGLPARQEGAASADLVKAVARLAGKADGPTTAEDAYLALKAELKGKADALFAQPDTWQAEMQDAWERATKGERLFKPEQPPAAEPRRDLLGRPVGPGKQRRLWSHQLRRLPPGGGPPPPPAEQMADALIKAYRDPSIRADLRKAVRLGQVGMVETYKQARDLIQALPKELRAEAMAALGRIRGTVAGVGTFVDALAKIEARGLPKPTQAQIAQIRRYGELMLKQGQVDAGEAMHRMAAMARELPAALQARVLPVIGRVRPNATGIRAVLRRVIDLLATPEIPKQSAEQLRTMKMWGQTMLRRGQFDMQQVMADMTRIAEALPREVRGNVMPALARIKGTQSAAVRDFFRRVNDELERHVARVATRRALKRFRGLQDVLKKANLSAEDRERLDGLLGGLTDRVPAQRTLERLDATLKAAGIHTLAIPTGEGELEVSLIPDEIVQIAREGLAAAGKQPIYKLAPEEIELLNDAIANIITIHETKMLLRDRRGRADNTELGRELAGQVRKGRDRIDADFVARTPAEKPEAGALWGLFRELRQKHYRLKTAAQLLTNTSSEAVYWLSDAFVHEGLNVELEIMTGQQDVLQKSFRTLGLKKMADVTRFLRTQSEAFANAEATTFRKIGLKISQRGAKVKPSDFTRHVAIDLPTARVMVGDTMEVLHEGPRFPKITLTAAELGDVMNQLKAPSNRSDIIRGAPLHFKAMGDASPAILFGPDDLMALLNAARKLPQTAKQADTIYQLFNDPKMKSLANETSTRVRGFDILSVPTGEYYPKGRWRGFMSKAGPDTLQRVSTNMLEAQGRLKARVPRSRQPIEIMDMYERWLGHVSGIGRYAAYMEPLRNARMLLTQPDFKNAIAKYYGRSWLSRLHESLKIIENPMPGRGDLGSRALTVLIGNMYKAFLGYRPHIAGYQMLSYGFLLREMDAQHVRAGLHPTHRDPMPVIEKWSVQMKARNTGSRMAIVGPSVRGPALVSAITPRARDRAMGWIANRDRAAIRWTWHAVRSEIMAKRPDLAVNSDEFYRAVAARFDPLVADTQPFFHLVGRSFLAQEAAGGGTVARLGTLFGSVRESMMNQLIESALRYRDVPPGPAKARARARLVRDWTIIFSNSVGVAGIARLWRRMVKFGILGGVGVGVGFNWKEELELLAKSTVRRIGGLPFIFGDVFNAAETMEGVGRVWKDQGKGWRRKYGDPFSDSWTRVGDGMEQSARNARNLVARGEVDPAKAYEGMKELSQGLGPFLGLPIAGLAEMLEAMARTVNPDWQKRPKGKGRRPIRRTRGRGRARSRSRRGR